ncbi:MAG TPA: S8 family serine peptidase [Candidatus Kryptonia bacterium]|nr:S8 family serine peptidase [Candidatus Kryptonia bacterium]
MLRTALAVTVLTVCSTAVSAQVVDRVGPHVAERLATSDRIEVVVALRAIGNAKGAAERSARRAQIARRRADVLAAALTHAQPSDIAVHHQFATASGFTATVSRAGLAALAAHPDVVRIDESEEGSAALANSVPQIRADAVHGLGIDGRGVTVALLDTAVDTAHPDLVGHIVAEECFCSTGCCPGNLDRLSGPGSATGTGAVHGTHVTGIIVSQGTNHIASIGVAPGADVVAIRVLNDSGRGTVSDWVAALDWLATNRPDVRAVNMSLVTDAVFSPNCDDASALNMLFKQVVDELRGQGTLVFAASGNAGNATMMAAPACVSSAVAVGAVDINDNIASFSNSGATLALLAPGVEIRSTAPFASTAVLSGTSMATPHAVGVAALLWDAVPELSPDEVETFMRTTGKPVTDARNGLVFPRIDALGAYGAAQFAGPLARGGGSSLSDCLVEWQITPRDIVRSRARVDAFCQDGDPACDHDTVAGQCTFNFSLCFNVPDGRIPFCRTDDPITRVSLFEPRPDSADGTDAGNAAATLAALPPTPITGEHVCTAPIALTVPIGSRARGGRMLHVTAETVDRRDTDRANFICLPR